MDCMTSDRVRVVVRVRPKQGDEALWVHVPDARTVQTVNDRNKDEALQYEFARVFGPDSDQKTIYDDTVYPLLITALQGKNSSCFAYGPTGAGKTFTILGTEDQPGLIPRCVRDLCHLVEQERASEHCEWKIDVSFSYTEIYNEKVRDLLSENDKPLTIVEDHNKQIQVMGLTEKPLRDVYQFNELFGPASNNRTTAATGLNERSSRSHSLLVLKVSKVQKAAPYRRLTGKIYLIDLAGSEDNRRTGNEGLRLKESGAINTSLLVLGQVVEALNKSGAHVPYRGSKLTRLLQDSLGGSAMTTMIVNLSPEESHYHDTKMTLKFARKSKKIVNNVKVHQTFDQPVDHFAAEAREEQEEDAFFEDAEKQQNILDSPKRILSPLIRNQKHLQSELRKEVIERIDTLEEKLMKQIRSCVTQPKEQKGQVKGADSTSTEDYENSAALPVIEQLKKSFDSFKRVREVPNFDSDLDSPFLLPTKRVKRRTKRSVASSSYIKEPDTPGHDGRTYRSSWSENEHFDPEAQKRRNDYVLNVLNTGSVKDLERLVTVGPKRAEVIHDYRNIRGRFQSFDDLFRIPSLTSKFVNRFLSHNLVRL